MARGGYGNFAGWHYSKKNCEELIREFFKREGFEIDQYRIPFKYAKELAVSIKNEAWTKEYFGKSLNVDEKYVDELIQSDLITLKASKFVTR